MKVGILSFWWSENNYGQLLQLYALYNYVSSCGYDVEIIKYKSNYKVNLSNKHNIRRILKGLNPVLLSRYVHSKIKSKRFLKYETKNPRNFSNFRKDYLSFSKKAYSSYNELLENNKEWDILICGSDQVWNYFPSGEKGLPVIDVYSLAFGSSKSTRISYAASMGFDGISEVHGKRLATNLEKFKGVSVREKHAVKILNNFGVKNVVWVPDPTMLIGPEGYSKFIRNDDKYKVPFFLYGLSNTSVFTAQEVAKQLLKHDKTFEYVGANASMDKEISCYPTIEEWLSYVYNAQTIITNSFHGCIFCILFQKNFYYYPLLPNKNGAADTRIVSILDRLGIKDRAINNKKELIEIIKNPYRPIDWKSVKKKQGEFVLIGKDFLNTHLNFK